MHLLLLAQDRTQGGDVLPVCARLLTVKDSVNSCNGRSLLQEYDLEQKIDLEIKMREGTTKLLAACRHQTQTLEAAKNLLTSNERMSAYMAELQRRKKEAPSRGSG